GPSALPMRADQAVLTDWLGVNDSSEAGLGLDEPLQPATRAAASITAPACQASVSPRDCTAVISIEFSVRGSNKPALGGSRRGRSISAWVPGRAARRPPHPQGLALARAARPGRSACLR